MSRKPDLESKLLAQLARLPARECDILIRGLEPDLLTAVLKRLEDTRAGLTDKPFSLDQSHLVLHQLRRLLELEFQRRRRHS